MTVYSNTILDNLRLKLSSCGWLSKIITEVFSKRGVTRSADTVKRESNASKNRVICELLGLRLPIVNMYKV